jgi:hypothetical protein
MLMAWSVKTCTHDGVERFVEARLGCLGSQRERSSDDAFLTLLHSWQLLQPMLC